MVDKIEQCRSVPVMAETLAHGLFPRKVARIDGVPRGVMNHKFKVSLFSGESYAIRLYPPGREKVVNYEPDLLRRSDRAGLPVPKVLLDSRSGPAVGLNYTVYRWIHGVPLDERLPFLDRPRLAAIAKDLVSFLDRFAQLEVVGFGELVSATQARFNTWTEFVESNLGNPATGCISHSRELGAMHSYAKAGIFGLSERKPVLAWGDISPENILLDSSEQVAGLVDFEGAMSADYSLTLGYCCARYINTPFFEALRAAWPASDHQHLDGKVKFYAFLRGLRLARFANLPMPTGCVRQPVENVLPGFDQILKHLRQQHH